MCRRNRLLMYLLLGAVAAMIFPLVACAEFKVDDTLPDLATFHLEGKLPEKLRGQVILLDFWASWCGPCKRSFPAMEALRQKYKDQGITILAISVDEKQENMDRFVKETGVTFPILRDAQKKLASTADVHAMPTSFLIDRAGKIRFIHTGFDPDKTPGQYAEEIDRLLKENAP